MIHTILGISISVIIVGLFLTWIIKIIKTEVKKDPSVNQEGHEQKIAEYLALMSTQFESIANKTLVNNSEYIQESSRRSIGTLLDTMRLEIKDYEARIEKMLHQESLDREGMRQTLNHVNGVYLGLSEEAKNFSISIKGNIHALGRLGELSLQGILDASAYVEGKDYWKQRSCATAEEVSIRPDFILTLPNGRGIAVDSKLSLDSFLRYMEEPDENARKVHAEKLVENIQAHVASLSKKKYQTINEYQMMDFVLMYVSCESVVSLSLKMSPNLLRDALKKNIVIVTPSSMMVSIRCLELLGREQRQAENLQEIALVGKKLYEKMSLFFDRLSSCQDHLAKASKALDTSINHLTVGEHSIVNEALRLKELGVATEKEIVCPKPIKKDEV